jgi:hypothetical protein
MIAPDKPARPSLHAITRCASRLRGSLHNAVRSMRGPVQSSRLGWARAPHGSTSTHDRPGGHAPSPGALQHLP